MKTGRKIMVVALIAALMLASISFAACGKVDYSTWTYTQFAESDIDWNSDIKYQFCMRAEGNSSTYVGTYPGLLNLRKDGSAVMFGMSPWCGAFLDPLELEGWQTIDDYENTMLIKMFFGSWIDTDGAISVTLTYGEDIESQTKTVTDNGDGTLTVALKMAYSGGYVPVDSELDCNGTVQYADWKDYAQYVKTDWVTIHFGGS